MSGQRPLTGVPVGYDQVDRRSAFEAANPGARAWHDGSGWRAQWSLGGDPLQSRRNDLRSALNDLDDWAVMAAGRRLMMREFPGWHVYVSRSLEWAAFPLGWPEVPPPLVAAADAAGLRAAIRAARESWRAPFPEGASM